MLKNHLICTLSLAGLLFISGCTQGLITAGTVPSPEPPLPLPGPDSALTRSETAAPAADACSEMTAVVDDRQPETAAPAAVTPPDPTQAVPPPAAAPSPTAGQSLSDQEAASPENAQIALDDALDSCREAQDFWQKGELENALEVLDHAYALILDAETSDNSKLVQQKEDLRFLISKRILEIYASRNIVVNGSHNAIPLVMNRHIQAELNLFTSGCEKKFFRQAYKRAGMYRPYILAELRKAGLPEELSWIPLIESGFKSTALSKARALGLWQFIPSTGYKFGLKRDLYIDERIDPVKATAAAIAYLKELHQIFGDWTTVLAAYNCGEGRVLRVIRNQNVNYLDNFWDLYQRLPIETARYVPRFLATLHIVSNPRKYGLDDVTPDAPLEYETVTIAKQVHLANIGKKIGVPQKTLKTLNPELRYGLLPPGSYSLRVPPHKGAVLLAAIDQIPVSSNPQPAFVYHRVRSGETLSTIARRYRTSVGKIMRANSLRRSNFIVAGKKLKIPSRNAVVRSTAKAPSRMAGGASMHVVKRGDSLWNIARRYGTTTRKIMALNRLTDTRLHIGQVLQLKPGQGDRKAVRSLKTYRVRRGDSPFTIARRYNMGLERFLQINQLTTRSRIFPNQKVYVD